MAERMAVPTFVARTARRLIAGGLIAAAAIWLGGEALERARLGAGLAESRTRLHAEVAEQFRDLGDQLDRAVRSITLDAEIVRLAERGDVGATRTLFDQAAAGAAAAGNRVAVTIVAANNQPVAWVGRSEEVPGRARLGPTLDRATEHPALRRPLRGSEGRERVADPAGAVRQGRRRAGRSRQRSGQVAWVGPKAAPLL